MPSKTGALGKSTLGRAPLTSSMSEESFNLLPSSHNSEQDQPMATPRYAVSSNRSEFKRKSPSSGLPPLPPKRRPTEKTQDSDREPLTNFAYHLERNHDSFDVLEAGYADERLYPVTPKQSLMMQRLKEMDDVGYSYQPQDRRFPRHCCCFMLTIFSILFSAVLIFVSLYLSILAKSPTLEMDGLNVTSFKYDGVSGGPPQVAAGLKFVIKVANPSKVAEFIYEQVRVELKYQESVLAKTSIPGFKQLKQTKSILLIELPETLTAIQDPGEALTFLQEVSSLNIQTDLRGALVGHYTLWGVSLKKCDLPVACKLNVEPEDSGRPAQLISSSCYHYPT